MADAGLALDGARLLVTGGAGFIGSNFVKLALARWPSCRVHVLDALTYAGNKKNLEDLPDAARFSFQHGDIRDPKAVAEAMAGATHVVNFAAESMVDRSIDDPGSFVLTDMYGALVLLDEARRRSIRRFVQISTDEVYGEILGDPATEESPLAPRNPYAASKAGGDRLAYAYHATYGMPVVITRCSNNYGPFQYPEKLIPLFVTNALEDQPLPVYGSGRNLRDWIHVEDHCRAIALLLESDGVDGETFNIGAGNELDVLTITAAILEHTGKPASLIRHVEDRPGHDRRYALDSSKLTQRTGWKPLIGFAEGIAKTIEWYRARRDWWEPIKAGEFRAYYEKMYGQRKVLKEVGS
ncbi:MAG: dTDP-glucose 4,6-dehydratase [Candidatus Eiseniibacteriota bacterium]